MRSGKCGSCGRPLKESQWITIDAERYKSCPKCSVDNENVQCFSLSEYFGTTPKRVSRPNPDGHRATALPAVLAQYQPTTGILCNDIESRHRFQHLLLILFLAIAPSANDLSAISGGSHAYSCITRWLSRVDLGESGQPSNWKRHPVNLSRFPIDSTRKYSHNFSSLFTLPFPFQH